MHAGTDDRSPTDMVPPVRNAGYTLVEVVVTIVLMSTIVIGILNAVVTAVKASSTSHSAARVETAIVNAADRINRAPKRCNYEIYAQAAVLSEGWEASRATVKMQYWVPGPTSAMAGHWEPSAPANWQLGSGCGASAQPPELIIQKVLVTITSPNGAITRRVEVVKSDV